MEQHHSQGMGWGRFAAMIATSTVIMFVMMYQLVYERDHAMFSLTRLISSLVMGCVMTAIMLAFMWKMYRPEGTKIAVLALAILGAAGLLTINRQQSLVDDSAFMEAMIPHHSIAVNNARKADIRDPRVRYPADRIIRDQIKEIAEMKALLADIDAHGRRGATRLPSGSTVLTPDGQREVTALVDGSLLTAKPL